MKTIHRKLFLFVSLNNSYKAGFIHMPFILVSLNVFAVFESLLKYLLWTISKHIFCLFLISPLVHELENIITNYTCHPH